MNNYTVYKHIFPNKKIYIGITKQIVTKRWNNGSGYLKQSLLYNAIKKYGWEEIEHKILFTNLSKDKAEQEEIRLILKYKSNSYEYGYNISNGGNTIGTHSEETKIKISIGNKKPKKKGWKHNEATKEKIRQKSLGINNHNYNKKLTTEQKEKLLNYTRKKVIQYDDKMNIIEIFKSVREAGRKTKRYVSCISYCCKTGALTKDGFYFKFVIKE